MHGGSQNGELSTPTPSLRLWWSVIQELEAHHRWGAPPGGLGSTSRSRLRTQSAGAFQLMHQSAACFGTRKPPLSRPVLIHVQESSTSQCSRGHGQEALRHPSAFPAGRRDTELGAPKLLDRPEEEPSPAVGEARGRRGCVCGGGRAAVSCSGSFPAWSHWSWMQAITRYTILLPRSPSWMASRI